MQPVLAKTFGGLTPYYYFRHFFFGLVLGIIFSTYLEQPSLTLLALVEALDR